MLNITKKLKFFNNIKDNDTVKPIWYHAINVAVPDQIKIKDTGFLYISGGGNDIK
jgi:hypothetical protein